MDETEHEVIEERLRRYQPAGPPADLRARIVGENRGGSLWWIWLPAALSAAAALVLVFLSASAHRDLMAEFAPESSRDAAVNAVVAEIGGGEWTRALVARLIELDQQAATTEQRSAAGEGWPHE